MSGREGAMSDEYKALFQIVKGTPFTVWAALWYLGGAATVKELEEFTSFKHQAVEQGLNVLASQGITQRDGRRGRWYLTSIAKQLWLFGPNMSIAENQQLVGGGSGLSTLSINESIYTTTTTEPIAENQQLTITAPLVQSLISMGGIGPDKAHEAVERALSEHGIAPTDIERRIAACAHYIHSPTGKGIHSPGAWAASLIGAGYEPPLPAGESDQDEARALSRFDGFVSELKTPSA